MIVRIKACGQWQEAGGQLFPAPRGGLVLELRHTSWLGFQVLMGWPLAGLSLASSQACPYWQPRGTEAPSHTHHGLLYICDLPRFMYLFPVRCVPKEFLCKQSCHLQIKTVLLFPFQSIKLFLFLLYLCFPLAGNSDRNRNSKSRPPSFQPDPEGKATSLSPLSILLAVVFLIVSFIRLKKSPVFLIG